MFNKIKQQARHSLPFVIAFLYGNIVHASTASPASKEEEIYNSLKTINIDQIMSSNGKTETKIRDDLQKLPVFPFNDLNPYFLKYSYIKNKKYNYNIKVAPKPLRIQTTPFLSKPISKRQRYYKYDCNNRNYNLVTSYITAYPLLLQLRSTKNYADATTGDENSSKKDLVENMWEDDLFWKLHTSLVLYFLSKKFEKLGLTLDQKKKLIGSYADIKKEDMSDAMKEEATIIQHNRPHKKQIPSKVGFELPFMETDTASQAASNWVNQGTLLVIVGPTTLVTGYLFMNGSSKKSRKKKGRREDIDILNNMETVGDW